MPNELEVLEDTIGGLKKPVLGNDMKIEYWCALVGNDDWWCDVLIELVPKAITMQECCKMIEKEDLI